jgi:hypothetical protein
VSRSKIDEPAPPLLRNVAAEDDDVVPASLKTCMPCKLILRRVAVSELESGGGGGSAVPAGGSGGGGGSQRVSPVE